MQQENASEEAPLQCLHAAVAPEECGTQGEYRRGRGFPPGLSHHRRPDADSLNSKAELAVWRRQQRQLVAAGRSIAKAMQPEVAGEDGQDGQVVGAEAEAEAEELPPVHHKAWDGG